MSRRLLAAAALAVALTPVAAEASAYSVRNPADGCTYTVYSPEFVMGGGGGGASPSLVMVGGFGESVACP
ncbi:MAG TPA: hypothetical protein VF519_00810 [Mycobacteriales bacterium]